MRRGLARTGLGPETSGINLTMRANVTRPRTAIGPVARSSAEPILLHRIHYRHKYIQAGAMLSILWL